MVKQVLARIARTSGQAQAAHALWKREPSQRNEDLLVESVIAAAHDANIILEAEDVLLVHGDPLSGGDYQLMQDIRGSLKDACANLGAELAMATNSMPSRRVAGVMEAFHQLETLIGEDNEPGNRCSERISPKD
jgi:hypothetical protein